MQLSHPKSQNSNQSPRRTADRNLLFNLHDYITTKKIIQHCFLILYALYNSREIPCGSLVLPIMVIVKEALAQIDPQLYIDYAIRYGESLGLKHDETHVSKGNWNPWVNLYSTLGEETMKQNIRNALETLVDEDRKYFFVYCEPQADKSYRLYIFFG